MSRQVVVGLLSAGGDRVFDFDPLTRSICARFLNWPIVSIVFTRLLGTVHEVDSEVA